MNLIFLDFETFYSSEYTLTKLTPPEYILDPRFETILCATAINNDPQKIVDGPDFVSWLSQFDPKDTATVTFNALFDNAILAWRYNFIPFRMYDTMNLARALRGHVLKNLKLATVAPNLLGYDRQKGQTIQTVRGMRRSDIISKGLWKDFCAYAVNDNEQNRDIFKLLIPELPNSEHLLMDLVIRAAVEPTFEIDVDLLKAHLSDIQKRKAKLICDCIFDLKNHPQRDLVEHRVAISDKIRDMAVKKAGLMSQRGFKDALERHGVVPGKKISPATGKETYAFAKSDQFMIDLQQHPNPDIQTLAAARLGVRSTIEETRTETLLRIAALDWSGYRRGNAQPAGAGVAPAVMPIALRYSGAHTHRLSGDWRLNMQNMPRGSNLRKSLIAGPGKKVIAGDLAQIEARVVAWLARQLDLLATFSTRGKKGDPYSSFASKIFGFLVDKNLHPVHRFIGKTGVLGLGYGCGVDKFYLMVTTSAALMGIDLAALNFDYALAEKTVNAYRNGYDKIRKLWGRLDGICNTVWRINDNTYVDIGPVRISYGTITGPNGLNMKFDDPCVINYEYHYKYGPILHKMYGAKLLENIVQFISRIIIMNAALRLAARGYRFVLQAHDELVFIVDESDVDNAKSIIYDELVRPNSWCMDLPLDSEVKSGNSYGDCK